MAGWKGCCCSLVECTLNKCEALDSIPSTTTSKQVNSEIPIIPHTMQPWKHNHFAYWKTKIIVLRVVIVLQNGKPFPSPSGAGCCIDLMGSRLSRHLLLQSYYDHLNLFRQKQFISLLSQTNTLQLEYMKNYLHGDWYFCPFRASDGHVRFWWNVAFINEFWSFFIIEWFYYNRKKNLLITIFFQILSQAFDMSPVHGQWRAPFLFPGPSCCFWGLWVSPATSYLSSLSHQCSIWELD